VIAYVNRLSDYLFILARYINTLASIPDTPWHPA
ncbi:MAG: ATP:cob(I)alamin adenosyltransferase, partial [Muribaculaceae bacterium]|nr:ATP:cob(I)alamin adenosyltransferase [Muribaculaceae bacterium]